MSKKPAHRLIVSWPVLEINRSCGMAKLVNCDTKASRFQYPLGDLLAEKELHLWLTALTREEPGGVGAAQQRWPEVMDVFVDQIRQCVIELKIQIDPVLHIVMRENQPIGRARPAGLDEVVAQLNADKVAQPDGRESEDRDRNSELRRDRSLDWRVILGRARLLHER